MPEHFFDITKHAPGNEQEVLARALLLENGPLRARAAKDSFLTQVLFEE